MSNPYQNISGYTGTLYGEPRYNSIEYDYEVPENLVTASPGGVYSVQHHWTKGFNGRGNTSSDVYAFQGERYNSGIYGNLYNVGQESSQQYGPMVPDYQFWQNKQPTQYSYSQSVANQTSPPQNSVEGYNGPDGEYTLIEPADISTSDNNEVVVKNTVKSWVVLLLLFIGFLVFSFWVITGEKFLYQQVFKKKKTPWQAVALCSVVLTIIFLLILWLVGNPKFSFEK